jgi:hypothetical protein
MNYKDTILAIEAFQPLLYLSHLRIFKIKILYLKTKFTLGWITHNIKMAIFDICCIFVA